MEAEVTKPSVATVISPEQLLEHWQGHRRLTRKVIEAFPEDKLFTFSLGGMRPFSELAMEFIQMASPGMDGIVTSVWQKFEEYSIEKPTTKSALLQLWDETTEKINRLWPLITAERFHEVDDAFGMYRSSIVDAILYFIDNEVHHRGQGYVYLRALGITPPMFWER
jgi:uncharacterized damage-inducible protein DinB